MKSAAQQIRDWYHASTHGKNATFSDRLPAAYLLLRQYTARRYEEMLRAGWSIERDMTGEPPDMLLAAQTRVLPVYDDAHEHPLLFPAENFLFRAVHDWTGHRLREAAGSKTAGLLVIGFGFENEIRAAVEQAQDLTFYANSIGAAPSLREDAVGALACEIIAQAACLEVDGAFPPQRVGILPRRLWDLAVSAL